MSHLSRCCPLTPPSHNYYSTALFSPELILLPCFQNPALPHPSTVSIFISLPLLSPPPQPCFAVDSLLAFCPSFFHHLQEPVPCGKQHKVQASCCQAAVSFSAFPAATRGMLRVVAARLPACSSCPHHRLPSPSLATHRPSLSSASTKSLPTCPCSFPFSDSSFPRPFSLGLALHTSASSLNGTFSELSFLTTKSQKGPPHPTIPVPVHLSWCTYHRGGKQHQGQV